MPNSGVITEGAQDFVGQKTWQMGASTTTPGMRTSGTIYATGVASGNGPDQTEDTLAAYTLPANALDVLGRNMRIRAWGTTNASVDNKQVKLYFGASLFATGVAAANNKPWYVELNVIKSGANAQSVSGRGEFNGAFVASTYTAGADTDTAAIVIKCTGQDSTASTANAIVLQGMTVEFLN